MNPTIDGLFKRMRSGVLPAALAMVGIMLLSASAEAGIIHRWSFNTDAMAEDSVGTADGTLVNAATVTGGQLVLTDLAMAPYVSLPAATIAINTFTDVTVEAWYTGPFNTATPPAPIDPGGFRALVMLGDKCQQPGGCVHGAVTVGEGQGQDYLMIQPWRGGGPVGANRGAITNSNFAGEVGANGDEKLDGLEHVLALTVTKTATGSDVRYYIDGVQAGATASATFDLSALSNALGYIGRSLYNDPAMVGSINEVRIYDMALSGPDLVREVGNGPNGNPVPEPSTIGLAILGVAGLIALRRRS